MFRLNKKASGQKLKDNLVFLLLAVTFLSVMMFFIFGQASGAKMVEQYFVKEISKQINKAQVGDEITFDIQKATEIAEENKLQNFEREIFSTNSENNGICFKISQGEKSCYQYFKDVDVDYRIELIPPNNLLILQIKEKENA